MPAPRSLGSRLRDARRRRVLLLVSCTAAVLWLTISAAAWADPFGQVDRIPITPTPSYVFTERTVAFGVDAEEGNAVYLGAEAPPKKGSTEPSGEFQIQKYDATSHKLLAASAPFKPKPKSLEARPIEGVAVDHSQGRIYVLAVSERKNAPDEEEAAAGTLYAFKTSNLESAVPGAGEEEKEGVLANAKVLKAQGKKLGEALLNPTGIALDPSTHDVVMLGEVDQSLEGFNRHLAVQRVTSTGALASRYMDPLAEIETEEANSPVVSPAGTVFAQREGQMIRIPSLESSAPTAIFEFNPREFASEELVEFNPEPERKGAGLALVPGGEEKSGKLWSASNIYEQQLSSEGLLETLSPHPGALALEYKEGGGGSVSTSEIGWSGGRNEQAGLSAPCTIAEGVGEGLAPIYPLLAAGSEGKLFLFSSKTSEVIELGSGGSGCPHMSVSPIVAAAGAGPTSEAPVGGEVALSSEVAMGNVVSAEWSFGDGTSEKETPLEFQRTEVIHIYEELGTFTIVEKIKSDNLASPEAVVERTLSVKYPTAITTALAGEGKSAASITVKEGTAVSDQATLTGTHVGDATGTVTYKVFSDEACSKPVEGAGSAGTMTVSAGSVGASEAKTLAPGTYYWRASYSGDSTHLGSMSICGSEVERVEAQAATPSPPPPSPPASPPASPAPSSGVLAATFSYRAGLASRSLSVTPAGTVVVKVACLGTSGCAGAVTLRTLTAVSAEAGKRKSILTLASGKFNLAGGQTKALTLHLSSKARKLLARTHVLRARATIVARDSSGALHTTPVIVTLREKRRH